MISIVSAYYKKEDMTKDFLDNLAKVTPECEMILTNAGSTPIEHSFITKRIDLEQNKSFANSMNAGLKEATGDYICIVGNDVFPSEGWLGNLVNLADKTGAWITAPLNDQTNLTQYANMRQFDGHFECDMFPAVCWLISRECLDKVGLFDERFELGCYEDNDYARRVRQQGGKIVVDKLTTVIHLMSQTISQFDIQKMMQTNYQKYIDKWS